MITCFKKCLCVFILLISPLCQAFVDTKNVDIELTHILAEKDANVALKIATALLQSSNITPSQRFSIQMATAELHYKLNDLASAIEVLIQASEHANSHQFIDEEAQSNKKLGIMYYYKRDNTKALVAYNKALEYFKSTQEFLKQAHLLNNIALVNAAMGDVGMALSNYQEAQKIYIQYGNEVDKVDVKFNIAGLYNRLHRYGLAITMYESVIEYRLQNSDKFNIANAYSEAGLAYFSAGNLEQAEKYYIKALNYYEQEKLTYSIATELSNLADVFYSMGMIEKSFEYANRCIAIARQSGNEQAHVVGLYRLSIILFERKQYAQASENIELATRMSLKSEDSLQLVKNKLIMTLILSAQGKTESALEALSTYKLASQQLQDKILATNLTQYQAQLESEYLQQQIDSLTQKDKLQTLKLKNTEQKYSFGLGIFILLIITAFYIYRSRNERILKERLSKKVKQRTQALELLMENLRESNDVKNQFLANMSHEIRTPLTAVIGQSEAIMAGDVEPEFINKEVEIIYNNSNHLLTLLNDILDLSRIEANKLELELQPHNINSIITDVYNLFTEQAKKKNLVFTVVNELSSSYVITIDQLRLKQILINLCSNAIKFTYKGHVTLHISCNHKQLNFSVKDTGIGLSEPQLKHIFSHFTQADSSISRRFGGSGLGLCLSQQLALMMNGNIHAESALGYGSKFSLSLPVSESQCQNAHLIVPEVTVEKIINTDRLIGTVLLADDHDDNRRLMKRLLEKLGLTVITATNGLEVLEHYKNNNVQLILLDIQMPEMDGIEAFKALKEQGANIPIIALTANAMNHEIEHYLSLGFDDYVSKPIIRPQFIKLLARHLKQTSITLDMDPIESIVPDDLKMVFEQSFIKETAVVKGLLAQSDYEGLSKAAHRLSGAAAMFGYTMIAKVAAEIEKEVKHENFKEIKSLTEQLINLLSEKVDKTED